MIRRSTEFGTLGDSRWFLRTILKATDGIFTWLKCNQQFMCQKSCDWRLHSTAMDHPPRPCRRFYQSKGPSRWMLVVGVVPQWWMFQTCKKTGMLVWCEVPIETRLQTSSLISLTSLFSTCGSIDFQYINQSGAKQMQEWMNTCIILGCHPYLATEALSPSQPAALAEQRGTVFAFSKWSFAVWCLVK